MKFYYTVYRPDGDEQRGEVEWPSSNPGLTRIDKLVSPIIDCESLNFEHVTILKPGWKAGDKIEGADMFVDENGLARRRKMNVKATALYAANSIRQRLDASHCLIVGTAIVFDQIVWR